MLGSACFRLSPLLFFFGKVFLLKSLSFCYFLISLRCFSLRFLHNPFVLFCVWSPSLQLRYKQRSMWPTPDTQLAMCWQPAHRLLYSGSVGGRVNAWDVETRDQKSCLEGHTDIVTQVLEGCHHRVHISWVYAWHVILHMYHAMQHLFTTFISLPSTFLPSFFHLLATSGAEPRLPRQHCLL